MTAANTPQPRTVEKFKPQPADEHQLGCPNLECARADELVLLETATVETRVELYDVGVTYPEIDRDEAGERIVPRDGDPEQIRPGPRVITGVRCEACRWAFTGPNPLSRLVRVEQ